MRRYQNNYSADPRWISAKYRCISKNGETIQPGQRVFYYPKGKFILSGKEAEQASRDFEAAKADEAFFNS